MELKYIIVDEFSTLYNSQTELHLRDIISNVRLENVYISPTHICKK